MEKMKLELDLLGQNRRVTLGVHRMLHLGLDSKKSVDLCSYLRRDHQL